MNKEKHIIENVIGWRPEDYDGYNDYYINNHKKINNYELDE